MVPLKTRSAPENESKLPEKVAPALKVRTPSPVLVMFGKELVVVAKPWMTVACVMVTRLTFSIRPWKVWVPAMVMMLPLKSTLPAIVCPEVVALVQFIRLGAVILKRLVAGTVSTGGTVTLPKAITARPSGTLLASISKTTLSLRVIAQAIPLEKPLAVKTAVWLAPAILTLRLTFSLLLLFRLSASTKLPSVRESPRLVEVPPRPRNMSVLVP